MAGKTLDTLVVRIEADVNDLKAGLNRAKQATDQASTGMANSFGKASAAVAVLKKAMIGIAAVAAVGGGLMMLAKRSLEAADAIAKTADKIGLSTDALQEYRYAADLAGVAESTFDMAMQRFSRRVGEAANGTGEAKEALKSLGLTLRDQNGNIKRSEDLLMEVADALKNTANPADRLRLAFKLFDSEGVAVVNMLKEGSAALGKIRQEARDLGLVLDESLIRNAEVANDRMTTLSKVLGIQVTNAVLQLAPKIQDLAEKMIKALPEVMKFIDGIGTKLGLWDDTSVEKLTKDLMYAERALAALDSPKAQRWMTPEQIADRRFQLEQLIVELEDLKRKAERVPPIGKPQEVGNSPGSPVVNIKALQDQKKDFELAANGIKDVWLDHLQEMIKVNDDFNESLVEQGRTVKSDVATPMEAYAATIENLSLLLRTGAIDQETYTRALAKARDTFVEADPAAKILANTFDNLGSRIASFSTESGDALMSLRSIALSVLNDIQGMILQMMVFDPLKKAIMGSLFGSTTSSSVGQSNVSGLAAAAAAAGVPRASGGPVYSGGTYLVGEKGPELITARAPGSVINNADTRGMMGSGVSPVFNIDARGAQQGVGMEIQRALKQVIPQIIQASVAATREGRLRNPKMFKAS